MTLSFLAAAAAAAAAAKKAAYDQEKAAIMARKRGVFQDPAAFTAQREAALEELDKRHAVNVDEDDKDESPEKKLENLLQDAFEAEQVLYLKYCNSYAIHQLDGTVTWKPECVAKHGLPLDAVERVARYAFWPAMASLFPLHALVAQMVLGCRATSMYNERLHSVAGYVGSRLRSRLSAHMHEKLTLGRVMAMSLLKADTELKVVQVAAQAQGGLEVDDEHLGGSDSD